MNYVVDSYENYKEENRLTTNNARRTGEADKDYCRGDKTPL